MPFYDESDLAITKMQEKITILEREILRLSTYESPEKSYGTAFPTVPYAGQRFFRTDIGFDCYYDGTRWLTAHEYVIHSDGIESSAGFETQIAIMRTDYQWYFTHFTYTHIIVSTNDSSNYWGYAISSFNQNGTSYTDLINTNTADDNPNTWYFTDTNTLTNIETTNKHRIYLRSAILAGSPGLFHLRVALYYRLVIT